MGEPTAIYLRISDDREGRELGVQRQKADLVEAARRDGDTIVRIYCDNDISASTYSRKVRPEYQRMLEDARSGMFAKIRAYTTNRLTRRPREREDLIDLAKSHRIRYEYLRSPSFDLNTAAGRRIARILAAEDAGEPDDISERVSRKKLELAQAGEFLGGERPFGFEPDGLTPRPPEFEAIQRIYPILFAGGSVSAVADYLNEAGLPTARGNQWRPPTARHLLRRARNAGLSTFNGEIVGKGKWPAAVSEETWRAACALLKDPSRVTTSGNSRIHLGSGIFLCGVCDDGTTVVGSTNNGARGRRNRSYRCSKSAHLGRMADPVDEYVERVAVAFIQDRRNIERIYPVQTVDVQSLHDEAALIQEQINQLDDELDDRMITRHRWSRRVQRLTTKLDEVRRQIREAAPDRAAVFEGLTGNPELPRIWYGTRDDRSDGLSVMRRSMLINAALVVTLLPPGKGRPRRGGPFDRSTVRIEPR